ncbi:hypothetical protein L6452_05720 [Arctium lappa]|uniref:Uncharacterized protein n=1 Tax=Arctium lappa TaxID=4217 RepID=A0ACB9EGL6_ARCLA|nr:hypothetical protein L6452_05720 [Arctium lappa]
MFQFAKFEKSKERRLATELGYGFPIGDPWITDGAGNISFSMANWGAGAFSVQNVDLNTPFREVIQSADFSTLVLPSLSTEAQSIFLDPLYDVLVEPLGYDALLLEYHGIEYPDLPEAPEKAISAFRTVKGNSYVSGSDPEKDDMRLVPTLSLVVLKLSRTSFGFRSPRSQRGITEAHLTMLSHFLLESDRQLLQLLMPLTYMVCFSFLLLRAPFPLLRTQVAVFPMAWTLSVPLRKDSRYSRNLSEVHTADQLPLPRYGLDAPPARAGLSDGYDRTIEQDAENRVSIYEEQACDSVGAVLALHDADKKKRALD